MINARHLEDITKKLCQILPDSLRAVQEDIQDQFKDILQSAFSRLDLVTREEFDVQVKVLARTREKVEALQSQVDILLQEKKPHP